MSKNNRQTLRRDDIMKFKAKVNTESIEMGHDTTEDGASVRLISVILRENPQVRDWR